ncbi:hypothetical protein B0H34DRAFT_792138 [Crassisporium funariophilum]|nr:hypothetical protein B0H34DRAFT_792138 [Crassisporium funariophilum]
MDGRSHGVFVNAAGFLYASLGFSLSVLAALFNIFHRNQVQPVPTLKKAASSRKEVAKTDTGLKKEKKVSIVSKGHPSIPPNARCRPPLRTFSDQTLAQKPAPEPFPESLDPERARKRIHRRSRSIPIITIDYFGSTDALRPTSADFLKVEPRFQVPVQPLPRPLTFIITSPPEHEAISLPNAPKPDRHGFRLSSLKPSWIKDKPKVERRRSSPHLDHPPPLPVALPHGRSNSDEILTVPLRKDTKLKPRKVLRRMTSAPGPVQDKLPSMSRSIEKKKSLNLRTQPYEAPYFCSPPLPIPVRKPSTDPDKLRRSETPKNSLDKKISKSRLPDS